VCLLAALCADAERINVIGLGWVWLCWPASSAFIKRQHLDYSAAAAAAAALLSL